MQTQALVPSGFDSANGNFNIGGNFTSPNNGFSNPANLNGGLSNGIDVNAGQGNFGGMGQVQGQFLGMPGSGQVGFNNSVVQNNFGPMANPPMQQVAPAQPMMNPPVMQNGSPVIQNSMSPAEQCQEFLATGRCSAGVHCRFHHGPQATQATQAPSMMASAPAWQPPPKRSRQELDELKQRILAKMAQSNFNGGGQQMQQQPQPPMQQQAMGKGRLPPQVQNEQNRPLFKARICRHFMAGTCEYGASCSFAHGQHELGKQNVPSEAGNALALLDNGQFSNASPCPDFAKGVCPNGDECTFSHDVRNLPEYKKMLCKRYLRGGCVLAEQCGFAHGEHELRRGQAPQTQAQLPSELEIRSSIQFGDYKAKICENYLRGTCGPSPCCMEAHGYNELVSYKQSLCEALIETGKCSMGSNCPNAHSETELKDYKTQLCSDFAAGDCVAGERCSSAHGQQELRPAIEERVINMWRKTCATMGGQASALMNSQ